MKVLILAATHDLAKNSEGKEVPRPLLDLEDEPLLTVLVKRLAETPEIEAVYVVVNEAIRDVLEEWAVGLPAGLPTVKVIGDETHTREDSRGAVGDILYILDKGILKDDLIVVGGDNWFRFDLTSVVQEARRRSPAVVVSLVPPGLSCERFGMVETDANGLIRRFVEKPQGDCGGLQFKACCMYFFQADDLRLFEEFRRAQPTVKCSPGTFIEWLLAQGVPVFAVRQDSAWYDISARGLIGPDALRIRELVRRHFDVQFSTWERKAARGLQGVSSYLDLLDFLHDPDANLRILACAILGHLGDLLNNEGRQRAISALKGRLTDLAQNLVPYAGWQEDEDTSVSVSNTAAAALCRLGYAPDVPTVYEKTKKPAQ